MIAFKGADQIVDAQTGGHRERSQKIARSRGQRRPRRNEIRERETRLPARHGFLLAEQVEQRQFCGPPTIAVHHDVVVFARGGPEAVNARRGEEPLANDAVEETLRGLVHVAGGRAVLRMIENRGEASLQLPGGKEERPIDVGNEVGERNIAEHAAADERRIGKRLPRPVDCQTIRERRLVGKQRPLAARAVLFAQVRLELAVPVLERRAPLAVRRRGRARSPR